MTEKQRNKTYNPNERERKKKVIVLFEFHGVLFCVGKLFVVDDGK